MGRRTGTVSSLARGAGAPEAGLGAWGQGGQGQPDAHAAARALAVPVLVDSCVSLASCSPTSVGSRAGGGEGREALCRRANLIRADLHMKSSLEPVFVCPRRGSYP